MLHVCTSGDRNLEDKVYSNYITYNNIHMDINLGGVGTSCLCPSTYLCMYIVPHCCATRDAKSE